MPLYRAQGGLPYPESPWKGVGKGLSSIAQGLLTGRDIKRQRKLEAEERARQIVRELYGMGQTGAPGFGSMFRGAYGFEPMPTAMPREETEYDKYKKSFLSAGFPEEEADRKARRSLLVTRGLKPRVGAEKTIDEQIRYWQGIYNSTERDPLLGDLFPDTPERQKLRDLAASELNRLLTERETPRKPAKSIRYDNELGIGIGIGPGMIGPKVEKPTGLEGIAEEMAAPQRLVESRKIPPIAQLGPHWGRLTMEQKNAIWEAWELAKKEGVAKEEFVEYVIGLIKAK